MNEVAVRLYSRMLTIRKFEEMLLALFSKGELFGTTHSYIGQEAIACSLIPHLEPQDIVLSNHRCHGHYIEKTDDIEGLLAEIMGKEGAVCGGVGGSQHIKTGDFISNGIQGNLTPVGAGMAYANKLLNKDQTIVLFIGDGTLGEGVVYETLNMIALYSLPILIVVENNRYAQSTPIANNLSGTICNRFTAFGLSCHEQVASDALHLYHYFEQLIAQLKLTRRPHVEVLNTYRLGPHSKGDDFRSSKEIKYWQEKDPLMTIKSHLSEQQTGAIEERVAKQLSQLYEDVSSRETLE